MRAAPPPGKLTTRIWPVASKSLTVRRLAFSHRDPEVVEADLDQGSAEAPATGQSILGHAPASTGAQAYRELADTVTRMLAP